MWEIWYKTEILESISALAVTSGEPTETKFSVPYFTHLSRSNLCQLDCPLVNSCAKIDVDWA